MSNTRLDKVFPTGRIVQGSLYKAQDKDADGKPKLAKSGPNIGKPIITYFFAVAIAKTPGVAHWANESWGAEIWAYGHQMWPAGQGGSPTFAWKIEDGDSQTPNKKGKRNCDRPGFAGHWVVNFSSGFAPKVTTADGSASIEQPDFVKPGYFVAVFASIDSNRSDQTPGLYINHNYVAFQGYGEEIRQGPDPSEVFKGAAAAARPAGMTVAPPSQLPPGGVVTPPPAGTVAFPVPGVTPPPPAVPGPAPMAAPPPAAAPVAVAPAPAMILPPAAPRAPVAPVGPTMTPLAGAFTWAQLLAAGWNEATARTAGYIV